MYMEVIVKVAETCNLNCTYCYYFNSTNNDFQEKKKLIGKSTLSELSLFLARESIERKIKILQLDIHGGEPLLMSKNLLDDFLGDVKKTIDASTELKVALQTNGVLIDDDWIDVFSKHNVCVSISLDGSADEHDKFRLDKKGKGSYHAAIAGLGRLQRASLAGRILPNGIICVVNGNFDGEKIYNHFVKELGVKYIHYLLPECNHDVVVANQVKNIEKFIIETLHAWLNDGIGKVKVQMFETALGKLMRKRNAIYEYIGFTVRSDGAINPPDDLRNVFPSLFHSDFNVKTNSVNDFIEREDISILYGELSSIPEACKDCAFVNVCRGGQVFGQPENRFSTRNGLNNKSVYCEVYKALYVELCKYLYGRGIGWERIEKNLQ
ncbi:radical SAM protein [Chromobacterium sp. CV08]|uniref:radical SAM protein n=1 Tax=Chromobacterium sp. CV08 TaxID=3133274 RepID=UPI003DA94D84